VAALVALIQLAAARSGKTSPLSAAVTSTAAYLEYVISGTAGAARTATDSIARVPSLAAENRRLTDENRHLRRENAVLSETAARLPSEEALAAAKYEYPSGIAATVVGFDPENVVHTVTIDRGSASGVRRDDGVITPDGAVGRVIEVSPLASKVLLLTDITSKIPAVVQRGRWWGIATGTQTRVTLRYLSQDARLHVGDRIVTGEGRSFHAGVPLGRISRIVPSSAGALDQSAVLEPAVAFGRLDRVLVIPR